MSIETTGQLEAEDFKTSQSVAEGFVKNKADGEFEYGQAGSAWELIEAKEITTNLDSGFANRLVFSGLNGEVDDDYMLLFRGRYNDSLGASGPGPGGVGAASTTAFRLFKLGINGVTVSPPIASPRNALLRTTIHFNRGTGAHGTFVRSDLLFSLSLTSFGGSKRPADFQGKLIFAAKGVGVNTRGFTCTSSVNPIDPLDTSARINFFDFHIAGFWRDLVTNVTSLDIEFVGQDTVVLAGSSWYLYKIKK